MKIHSMLLITALSIVLSSSFVYAQSAKEPAPEESAAESKVLSTEMSGVDTLGVMPEEMITRSGSGTRRVKLETTVFRREEPVAYRSEGRRDPFRALIANEKKEGEIKTDLLRLENAILTVIPPFQLKAPTSAKY